MLQFRVVIKYLLSWISLDQDHTMSQNVFGFIFFIYLFIYLFRWRASYNNNRKLNNRKRLKQQDLEGRERLY